MTENERREREALSIALDALDEIALAGMSGTGMESQEAMTEWHARQAWKFIGIAARAKGAARASLRASTQPAVSAEARDAALDLLDVMFAAYEDGPACYEDPEEQAGYLGQAVKLDHAAFHLIADLLNKHRPRGITPQAGKEPQA